MLSVLTYGDDVPVVDLIGAEVAVTSLAMGLIVICIFVFLLLATSRALYLRRNQLLKSDKYFCVKKMSIATLLSVVFIGYTIVTGVMLTALTGSTVWIQVCVFVPLIMVSGGYTATQYFANDCSLSLTPEQRAKEIAIWRLSQQNPSLSASNSQYV